MKGIGRSKAISIYIWHGFVYIKSKKLTNVFELINKFTQISVYKINMKIECIIYTTVLIVLHILCQYEQNIGKSLQKEIKVV